jgi:hypothetical protein
MNEPVNHHFVPIFYLERWAGTGDGSPSQLHTRTNKYASQLFVCFRHSEDLVYAQAH